MKLYHFNLILVGILVILVILNLTSKFQNKEYEKVFWNAKIYSINENNGLVNSNLIKIVDATLSNDFNQSIKKLDYESLKENSGILSSKNNNEVFFRALHAELYPNTLELKYYSFDEKKFYSIKTKLPYKEILNISKNIEKPILLIEISNNGNFKLKIGTSKMENNSFSLIKNFTAEESTGNLEMLIYRQSLDAKYNDYEGIENLSDFTDLLHNEYKWSAEVKTNENIELVNFYAYTFNNQKIELLQHTDPVKPLAIPRKFYIYWKDSLQKEYNEVFYFNSKEILDSLKKSHRIEPNEPIKFKFEILDKKINCEISNSKISIPINKKL